jgi:hypothetical protein
MDKYSKDWWKMMVDLITDGYTDNIDQSVLGSYLKHKPMINGYINGELIEVFDVMDASFGSCMGTIDFHKSSEYRVKTKDHIIETINHIFRAYEGTVVGISRFRLRELLMNERKLKEWGIALAESFNKRTQSWEYHEM